MFSFQLFKALDSKLPTVIGLTTKLQYINVIANLFIMGNYTFLHIALLLYAIAYM